jgi:adenylate kinase family enzyme
VAEPILLLSGPPGAGKTTVAHILATGYERAAHVESDRFFRFIAAGYVEPWKPEAHRQNEIVMDIVASVAAGYARAGYFTIVDGIIIPGWFFERLRDDLRSRGSEVAFAVLRPSLERSVERAAGRSSDRLADRAAIEQLWSAFEDLGRLERHVIAVGDDDDEDRIVRVLADRLRSGALATG